MIWLLAATMAFGVMAPHLISQARLTPLTGASLWLAVLTVRAALVLLTAVAFVFYVPATQLFSLITYWCFHAVIPFLTAHLGFSAHSVGDVASIVPVIALGVSFVSALFAIYLGGRRLRGWVRESSLGSGPRQSVIVGGSRVTLAATGIRRPKVVVSTGALAALEDDELAAGLEHERGHIARRHTYLATGAELLFAVARILPGSREALSQVHFHLERDADEYAVRCTGNPIALASVICKAAGGSRREPALIGLASTGAPARLRILLDDSGARPSRLAVLTARGLAALLVVLAMALVISSPAVARSGLSTLQDQGSPPTCNA